MIVNQIPIKKITEKNDTFQIPLKLKERIDRRVKACYFLYFYSINHMILVIIGALLINCIYNTRGYILNGDDFWKFYIDNSLKLKSVPKACALMGIIVLFGAVISIMNLGTGFFHLYFGGVKYRLKFISKIIIKHIFI